MSMFNYKNKKTQNIVNEQKDKTNNFHGGHEQQTN